MLLCNLILFFLKYPLFAFLSQNIFFLMFALMREYISTYLYTVYDVMATNINVVLC